MQIVFISDTHFGVKSGSMTWFRSQMDFMRNQLIPYLKTRDDIVLVHLGDVFDSRSTINTCIAQEVRDLFEELTNLVNEFYVLQGNHDSYSPVNERYNTLELILGSIRAENFHIISDTTQLQLPCIPPCAKKDTAILLPWFEQAKESVDEFTKRYKGHVIFTHADIIMGNPKIHTPVFSGHVHTPYINKNIRNLGSCYSLDFHDAGQKRYFYVWDPVDDSIKEMANEHSIRFWRVYNEDVLTRDWSVIKDGDYVEVYIKYSLLQDNDYQEQCKELRKIYKNCSIIPLPDELISDTENIDCDMEEVIENCIPDDLRDRFEYIKSKINNPNDVDT